MGCGRREVNRSLMWRKEEEYKRASRRRRTTIWRTEKLRKSEVRETTWRKEKEREEE